MANTKSAKKALRGSLRKKDYNSNRKSAIKDSLKQLRLAISTNPSEVSNALAKAFSSLDKAAKSNFIPKERASRKKSRLALMVAKSAAVSE